MGRNYEKEALWAKNKYCRILVDVDKEIGTKFKEKIQDEGKTISEVLKEFIENYVNE